MKHAIIFTAAAVLLTACAAPTSARLSEAKSTPIMRAAPNATPWMAYRTFTFDPSSADIVDRDLVKIEEIVAHLQANPSLDVAIDGTLTVDGASVADRSLADRRASAIRRALMDTGVGVASYRLYNGAFADPRSRKPGEVQVVIGPRTGRSSTTL